MKAVIDTNILIDYLRGDARAKAELARFQRGVISIVTFMEVLVGTASPEEEGVVREFLGAFSQRALDREVAENAVGLRRQHGLKLPDAIIYATARAEGCLLVTRNTKDFDPAWPDVRVPYPA